MHLDDLVLRRTIMALLGQLSLDLLEELAVVLAPVLAWSQEITQQEIERTVKLLSEVHGVTLNDSMNQSLNSLTPSPSRHSR